MPSGDIQKPVAGDLNVMSVTLLTRVLLNLRHHIKSSTKMFTCLNVRYVAKGSCPGRVKNSMKRDMVRRGTVHIQGDIATNVRKGSHGLRVIIST